MRVIITEGLETDEQRAWFFWNLKNGDSYVPVNQRRQDVPLPFNKPIGPSEYDKLGDEHTSQQNMSHVEMDAVQSYTGSGYYAMNDKMRNGEYTNPLLSHMEKQITDAQIDTLKDFVDKSKLPRDISVYRGFSEKRYKDLQVGSTLEDKGFVSTSTDLEIAKSFFKAETGAGWKNKKIFQLNLPKGSSGLAVGDASSTVGEREILLNPQKFVVTHITTKQLGKTWNSNDKTLTTYHLSPVKKGE